MAFTKVTHAGIGSTGTVLLQNLDVIGIVTAGFGVSTVDVFTTGITTFFNGTDSTSTTTGSVIVSGGVGIAGSLNVGGSVSVGGTLTYEDVTNIDSVGIITARSDILVGSGITLSPDGDIFFTGIMTGNGSGLTGVANTDVIFTDKLSVGDLPARINIGVGSDVQIYHDGDNTTFLNQTGVMTLKNTGSGKLQLMTQGSQDVEIKTNNELSIKCNDDGAVELYHDASKKLETASGGVTVTGTVAATSYTGDGSALTGIAVGIATTVATGITGITTVLDLSNNDHKITVSGITTVDVRGGTEGDSHSLRIINSGITTVGFSTYFLFPSGGTPNLPTADGALSMISFTVHRQGVVGLATQLFAGASVNFS